MALKQRGIRHHRLRPREQRIATLLNQLAKECYAASRSKGFTSRGIGTDFALLHGEISEAMEAHRHGNPESEHIPGFSGIEEEMADELIRVLETSGRRGYRIGQAVIAKLAFNLQRPRKHGKKL